MSVESAANGGAFDLVEVVREIARRLLELEAKAELAHAGSPAVPPTGTTQPVRKTPAPAVRRSGGAGEMQP